MSFIGIVANSENYDFIENRLKKNSNLQCINLNENSIENMQNIKFETIAICTNVNNMKFKYRFLKGIIKEAKYLIINSDVNSNFGHFNCNSQIITYGMNQRATVTASSIKEDELLICLQRNMTNVRGVVIEIQEFKARENVASNEIVYNLLAICAIEQLYG